MRVDAPFFYPREGLICHHYFLPRRFLTPSLFLPCRYFDEAKPHVFVRRTSGKNSWLVSVKTLRWKWLGLGEWLMRFWGWGLRRKIDVLGCCSISDAKKQTRVVFKYRLYHSLAHTCINVLNLSCVTFLEGGFMQRLSLYHSPPSPP